MCKEKIDNWLKWCQEKHNSGLYGFLTKLNSIGVSQENFDFIYLYFNDSTISEENETAKDLESIYSI